VSRVGLCHGPSVLLEDADATGTDEQSDDDEDDAPEDVTTGEKDIDTGDHQDHRDEP
jgi:hypothetical protein